MDQHTITRTVQFTLTVVRGCYVNAEGWGRSYFDPEGIEVEHQIRAEVTDLGDNEAPLVIWCDQAHVQDLGLSTDELQEAEERAVAEYDRVSRLVKAVPMVGQLASVSA